MFDLHLACCEIFLNSTTLIIHSERLDHQMSPKFSIFPIWRHKLPSGEYSKTFASNVVDVSKHSYSKLKVAHTCTKMNHNFIFQTRTCTQSWKMTSLEMTSYPRGKLYSNSGPVIFRFLVKFWRSRVHCWKKNKHKISTALQIQPDEFWKISANGNFCTRKGTLKHLKQL